MSNHGPQECIWKPTIFTHIVDHLKLSHWHYPWPHDFLLYMLMSWKYQYYHKYCWEKYMVTKSGCLQKSPMTNFWATKYSLQTTFRARSFGFLLLVLSLTAAPKRAAYLLTIKEWFMAMLKCWEKCKAHVPTPDSSTFLNYARFYPFF